MIGRRCLILQGSSCFPSSIATLSNLESLSINWCPRLELLPANLNELISLKSLYIRDTNIKSLTDTITGLINLVLLKIEGCFNLEELPANLNGLITLKSLYVCHTNIKSLPDTLAGLTNLELLKIEFCHSLEELPANLNGLLSLKELYIMKTNIKSLPDTINGLTTLELLKIEGCSSLEELPANLNGLLCLKELSILDTNIKSVPDSITTLEKLEFLNLCGCYSLIKLPTNLNKLVKLGILFPRPGEEFADYMVDGTTIVSGRKRNSSNPYAEFGEGFAHDAAVPAPGLETLDEHGMAPFDGEVRALTGSLDDGGFGVGSRNNLHNAENGNMLNRTLEELHRKNRRPTFLGHQPQNMMLVDTTLQLGVGWFTPRPNKRRHSATEEKSCSVSSCASNSSVLKVATPASAVDREHLQECLDAMNIHGGSGPPSSECHKMKKSRPDTSRGALKDSARGANHQVSTHASVAGLSPLVVKGIYKEENFRLEFSYTPCVDKLKKEVGEKLELELGKYKLEFRDEDDEWVVMKDNSDLKHCLRLARSSDSEIVKLKLLISDIVGK